MIRRANCVVHERAVVVKSCDHFLRCIAIFCSHGHPDEVARAHVATSQLAVTENVKHRSTSEIGMQNNAFTDFAAYRANSCMAFSLRDKPHLACGTTELPVTVYHGGGGGGEGGGGGGGGGSAKLVKSKERKKMVQNGEQREFARTL
jgi:hypothetical protein